MTADELVEKAHAVRPEIIYRAATDGNSVAAWCKGRWVPVAGKTIMPGYEWVSHDYELLIDGKPTYQQDLYGPPPAQEDR